MPQHSAAWVRVQPPANAHPGRRQHQAGLGSLPTHGRAGDAAPGRVRQRPGGRLPPARELTGLSERRERDGGFPSRLGARTNSRGGRARLTGRLSGRTLGPRRPQPHGDGRTTPLARRGRRGTRTRSPVARAPPSPLGHAQVPRGGSPREPPEKPPRGSPSSGPAALGHGRLCGLPRPLTRRRRHPPFSRLGHSKAGSARRRAGPCPQGCPRVGSGELARPEPAASPLPASRLVRAGRGGACAGTGPSGTRKRRAHPCCGEILGCSPWPWEKRRCSPTIMLEDAWCNPYSRTRRTGVQLVLLSGDARVQHPLMPGNIGVQPLSFTQGYRGAAPLPLVDTGVHPPTVPS